MIIDMPISVTADDIRDGQREACSACPVALAINRGLGLRGPELKMNAVFCRVTPLSVTFWRGCLQLGYVRLPGPAARFIVAYDADEPVSPFRFDLGIEDTLLQRLS